MSDIATELTRLQTAKANIKTSIENKGITVPSATTIDGYPALIDQISTGSQEAEENDVNFYDYDGFRVASFTIAQAKALTQAEYNAILPPTHEGLTFQEWNWTLNDITTYNRRYIDIGANYITTDGNTHIHCSVTSTDECYITFLSSNATVYVNWGDGSVEDSYSYGGSQTPHTFTHTYTNVGKYVIKMRSSGTYSIIMNDLTVLSPNLVPEEINSDNRIVFGANYALANLQRFLLSITKDTIITPIRGFVNTTCPMVVIPRNINYNSTGYNAFSNLNGRVSWPKQVKKIFSQSFFAAMVTDRIVVPELTDDYGASNDVFIDNRYVCCISIPLSFKFSSYSAKSFRYCFNLRELDIVQGWVPLYDMVINQSTRWSPESMVDFFTKLGTTTNAITLTFGSTNLDKLTADQKAIATNKGYTLA